MDTVEFQKKIDQIHNSEYTLLSEYINSHTKVLILHKVCGEKSWIYPFNILKGTRCPKCYGPNRITDEKFKKTVEELGNGEYICLDKYNGVNNFLIFKHLTCGRVFTCLPVSFKNGTRCPEYNFYHKMNKKEVQKKIDKIHNGEYQILSDYKSLKKKITILHKECGHVYDVLPIYILKGSRCPRCREPGIRFKKMVEIIGNGQYICLDEYKGMDCLVRFKHLTCGRIFSCLPKSFKNGARCPEYDVHHKRTKLEVQAILDKVHNYEYEILSDYKNSNTIFTVKHKECGHIYDVFPRDIIRGKRCPRCFNSTKISIPEKTIVYYLKKLGINYCENIKFDKLFGKSNHNLGKRDIDILLTDYNIAIYYDGPYHNKKRDKDLLVNKFLVSKGYKILRFVDDKTCFLNDDNCIEIFCNSTKYSDKDNMIKYLLNYINNTFNKNYYIDVNTLRDSQDILNLMNYYRKEKSIAKLRPDLLDIWDYDKNILNPNIISLYSKVYTYWKCEKGHHYFAQVANVSLGTRCPYCSNRKILSGFNDLATMYPERLKEWDYHKNKILPNQIFPKTNKKYWWICEKGHSYLCSPNNKISSNRGCPKCSRCSCKKVLQYDLKGNFIRKYENLKEVELITGYKRSSISRCCKGEHRTSYRYIWKFDS